MLEVLVNRLGGLSLPRKSVVRLTDSPDMTLDVYRGRKTTTTQQQQLLESRKTQIRFVVGVPISDRMLFKVSRYTLEILAGHSKHYTMY